MLGRVVVVGPSGAGKTTVARSLADRCDLPCLELDAIFHQPGWTPLPEEEFRDAVAAFVAGDRWVVDGNYSAVRDLVWARCDTVVWLDLPRWRVMPQLVARTLRRAITRQELWNGNREPLTGLLRWDPEASIVRWSWTTHRRVRDRYEAAARDPATSHLTFVRLRSRSAVRRWLARLPRPDRADLRET